MNAIFRAQLLKKLLATTAVVVTGLGSLGVPATAQAVYCSNCATFYQQMFEYVEAVNTTLNTAEQLRTQIQQYQNMVTQGTGLPNSMFGSIAADLQAVVSVYSRSQALGRQIQNLDGQFNTAFPSFQAYLNSVAASAPASSNMPDRYQQWSDQGRDNVRSALAASDLNTQSFASEDQQLTQMLSRSQSAVGRMQAIQAGNEIAAQNVQQLQKLRDLLATQINLQGNYMAQQQDRMALDDAVRQQRRSAVIIQTGSQKGY